MKPDLYLGQRAVVIGYGITGRAVAQFLTRSGAAVQVYDDRASQVSSPEPNVTISTIDTGFQGAVENADLVLVSPGVPRSHPVFKFAQVPISELELAYRHTTVPIVAVTGTNGKTTVTTLTARMLDRAGMRVRAVGNIGTSIVSMLEEHLDYFVVEASSFQLATISSFRPKVAVWTNFSPDHLDWHQGIDHYLSSKARIFENQTIGDTAVVNAADAVVSAVSLPDGVE
ncbi:MAG: UDP-N-acetylmuramoyl-L-alanine--D-glutamate ligase, partial [Actinomycetota bacterium]